MTSTTPLHTPRENHSSVFLTSSEHIESTKSMEAIESAWKVSNISMKVAVWNAIQTASSAPLCLALCTLLPCRFASKKIIVSTGIYHAK
jgi:hypothetical protein